jgi:hypothetical protein
MVSSNKGVQELKLHTQLKFHRLYFSDSLTSDNVTYFARTALKMCADVDISNPLRTSELFNRRENIVFVIVCENGHQTLGNRPHVKGCCFTCLFSIVQSYHLTFLPASLPQAEHSKAIKSFIQLVSASHHCTEGCYVPTSFLSEPLSTGAHGFRCHSICTTCLAFKYSNSRTCLALRSHLRDIATPS